MRMQKRPTPLMTEFIHKETVFFPPSSTFLKLSNPNHKNNFWENITVASLGLVSPGAVTHDVTLFFLNKN